MLEDFKTLLNHIFNGVTDIVNEGVSVVWYGLWTAAAGLLLFFFSSTLGALLFWLGMGFAGFACYFFRDPKRETVFSPDEIACPADGRVMTIATEGDPKVLVIRIFLSVFDVHIQRATIDGTVGEITYNKGKFLKAYEDAAGTENERNLIRISDGERFAHVEQITGAIARRIACWVKTSQQVKKGEKIGLIYFGSQAAIYLPADKVRVMVKPGQKVEGALTVLALWK
ncbi:MAG: phosphatidylserine decarboxylase family protein [Elusimicrobia bacterium]|nr:phosphatidylserine decarboxylase family protein [Elusimicrobiota bacterium]